MAGGVFLDRDGVLNVPTVIDNKAHAPLSLKDFSIVPGAPAAVERIRDAGFPVIIVTNQPQIATGSLQWDALHAMHTMLQAQVAVDDIFVCHHEDSERCTCRKPKPGMLEEAAGKWRLDLSRSYLIGDTWRDIEAGRAAGCYTVLLDRPYSGPSEPECRVDTLAQAVDHILSLENGVSA